MFTINAKQVTVMICFASTAMLISCSTVRKAELESSIPSEAIQEVETKQQLLISEQLDLFSPKDYKQGVSKLNEAKTSLKAQDEANKTMTLAAQAKALFEDVETNAEKKDQVPSQILDARKAALNAIADNDKKLSNRLAKVDNQLRDETDEFTENLDNDDFTKLQKQYLDLEVKGIQSNELHASRQVIDQAEADNAKKLAPSTLKTAKRNLVAAENLIAANVNNPSAYKTNVVDANQSAKLLHDVVNKSHEMGKGTSEKVALKLVYQDREIGKLSNNIDDLEGSLSSVTAEAATTSSMLSQRTQKLEEASSDVQFQMLMNEARNEFSDDEAAVYQQGNQLIIQLKKMDFASGSAELPGSSIELLSKVDNVIKNMGAKEVLVQGHTDSTGPDLINMKLSKDRADSVASYLKASENDFNISGEGYGESKPLASNNSKEGRALNRRVDIVVTLVK